MQPPKRTPIIFGAQPFAFGSEFQMKLLKLILLDTGSMSAVTKRLRPEFFENPAMRWIFSLMQEHTVKYGQTPSVLVLREAAKKIDIKLQHIYAQTVEVLDATPVFEEDFVRDQIMEWIQRNIFVDRFNQARQLYNTGQFDEALKTVTNMTDEIRQTKWQMPIDHFSLMS